MKTLQNFPYKRVLVLGLAKSGKAAAQLLYDSGVTFLINDQTPLEDNPIAEQFQRLGVEVVTGGHPISVLDGVDLVVKNPGIPHSHHIVEQAEFKGIPVVTEVELAYQLIDGPLVAITGTNGKTTTTTLIYEILKEGNKEPLIAGNIGKVASEVVRNQKSGQPVVMELSSFQLKATKHLKPDIAVLLNLTEAHLDYHETRQDYVESKWNITKNQTKGDVLVVNDDDPSINHLQKDSLVKRVPFSMKQLLDNGISFVDGSIYVNGHRLVVRKDIALPGKHNLENVLASIAVARQLGVTDQVILKVLKTFSGVKHRLQFVSKKEGRLFYNDSKATNILATTKAIQAFDQSIVLIAGGLDRGNGFDELIHQFENVKHCVAYGESATKIKNAASKYDYDAITIVESLEQAVNVAYQQSDPGDIVLLSPACASWDQFSSFETRGDMFIDVVHKL
ncbi:UDP-N-acetylmuramoyl-L-alanine--D-glutamate ligase [Alkalibacillus aidingensis]|uniref:UDP-N-acetylmuramoyl-L-alanine--D-glutamate ligase n=1 Tax=Alkalibacillus aidingensis TaxID=2747607 RepID=UPI001660DCF4|nr:UDP-N-acetylmuramoyl-L-alanine--D-glutamate ligase [Alkalibacillus aidingensis]